MGEILFLTHRVPWPPNRGDKIRSHHILCKLMQYAPVHLACFADDQIEASEASDIRSTLASCKIVERTKPRWLAGMEALVFGKPVSLTSFDSKEVGKFVAETINNRPIDCIFVFSGQMAQFIPSDFDGRVVMDFADVDSAKFESYAQEGSGPMAWINAREGRMLKAFEQQVARRADCSSFVSEAEAILFRDRSGVSADKIIAVGNGIDLDFYDPSHDIPNIAEPSGPLIVFTGQMDYRPNVQAVTSFAKEAMPEILRQYPGASFAIVGRAPTAEVKALEGENNSIVTGAVDDIRSWLKAASIIVAPLRIARGIQNKVLEAMAMEKPVIASTAAAQGIAASNGTHFLVAENVAEEARLVCDLLSNPEQARQLGKQAGALIRDQYSWNQQLAELPAYCGFEDVELTEAAE